MNKRAIELTEIKHDLAMLPPDKLSEAKDFVRRLLPNPRFSGPEASSLKGIWKDQGWEKLTDLEEEIRALREETGKQILDKFDSCNS